MNKLFRRGITAVLAAGVIGAAVWAPLSTAQNDETYRQLKLFGDVFDTVRQNYVEEVEEGDEELCKCKPHYEGSRCEKCGPGYYGQPEVIGDYCKPCECNGNIEVTDPESCDSVSGICQKCLFDTTGDQCERCENWFFGDAINAKNCRECSCGMYRLLQQNVLFATRTCRD